MRENIIRQSRRALLAGWAWLCSLYARAGADRVCGVADEGAPSSIFIDHYDMAGDDTIALAQNRVPPWACARIWLRVMA